MSNLVRLRRHDTSTPWGFRMNGGAEYGQPLYIQKVSQNSVAWKAGMRPGDGILQICSSPTRGMRHDQAKMEIIRAGNDVDFIVQRAAIDVGATPEQMAPPAGQPAQPAPAQQKHPQAEIVEETSPWKSEEHSHTTQSRSFRILQSHLED